MQLEGIQSGTSSPRSTVVPTLRGATTITKITEELTTLRRRQGVIGEARAIEEFIHVLLTEILPGEER